MILQTKGAFIIFENKVMVREISVLIILNHTVAKVKHWYWGKNGFQYV